MDDNLRAINGNFSERSLVHAATGHDDRTDDWADDRTDSSTVGSTDDRALRVARAHPRARASIVDAEPRDLFQRSRVP